MKVLRDTDGDGTPDVNDLDDDGDGINDTDEPGHSKDRTALTATATNPTNKATEGQSYTSGATPVVTKNKPNAVISSTETNGLKVNAQGQVEGTPSGLTWTGDAEEQTVSIPVTVTHPNDTAVPLTVEVKVLRDTDGDGTPDVRDDDDDNDGILDTQDGTPKDKTSLTAGKVTPTNKAVDGQPYTSTEKVINPNKPGTTVTPTPTNGLTIDGTSGKVTGTPTGLTWNGDDTEQTVNIPVVITKGNETVNETIPVVVQRDLDGDGKPDVSDDDIDGDGIPNDQDPAPRVKDALTSGKVTPTNKAVDGQPYTSTEKVINPNKPGTTVTPTPTNGLTIDGTSGKVTGTPTGLTWNGDDTEQTVNIPVVITKGNETVNEIIPVVVQRSSRNGQPETQEEISEYTKPIGTTGVDENGNLITPPTHIESQKVQFTITKWVDENGNELKPADVKAPTVLGEANEAFEHGEIEGYVFVRTETKGDVVTHVFRKLSPVRPTGDGQQRPATPSADTNRRPDTAIPAEVPATQPTEQPSQTVEVPTQLPNEVSETDSSVSQPQAVLPNTGTQEDRATGALGVLSLLGAFGLLFAKKKKDDEEEA